MNKNIVATGQEGENVKKMLTTCFLIAKNHAMRVNQGGSHMQYWNDFLSVLANALWTY